MVENLPNWMIINLQIQESEKKMPRKKKKKKQKKTILRHNKIKVLKTSIDRIP